MSRNPTNCDTTCLVDNKAGTWLLFWYYINAFGLWHEVNPRSMKGVNDLCDHISVGTVLETKEQELSFGTKIGRITCFIDGDISS